MLSVLENYHHQNSVSLPQTQNNMHFRGKTRTLIDKVTIVVEIDDWRRDIKRHVATKFVDKLQEFVNSGSGGWINNKPFHWKWYKFQWMVQRGFKRDTRYRRASASIIFNDWHLISNSNQSLLNISISLMFHPTLLQHPNCSHVSCESNIYRQPIQTPDILSPADRLDDDTTSSRYQFSLLSNITTGARLTFDRIAAIIFDKKRLLDSWWGTRILWSVF